MDDQPPEVSPHPARRLLAALGILAVLAYGLVIWRFGSGHAAGSDSSGYMNLARLLAAGRVSEPIRAIPGVDTAKYSPWAFTPLGYRPADDGGRLVPTYPAGLPLHILAASRVVPWDRAPVLVNTLAGASALLLMYLLGRRLELTPAWSAGATLLFAVCPLTVFFFVWLMSDGLATTWCLAALYFASLPRDRGGFAVAAGFAFGAAVLVRPTSVLLVAPLALTLPGRAAVVARFLAGAAAPAAAFGALNLALYGNPIATGYGNLEVEFALANFWPRAVHFATWLARFLTPVTMLLFAVAAWRAVRGDRQQAELVAWFAVLAGFYAFYRPSLEAWWYLRFILPAIPALLLAAALAASQVAGWSERRFHGRPQLISLVRLSACGVLLLGIASALDHGGKFRVLDIARSESAYPRGIAWMESRVEPEAAVVCMQVSGAMLYYSRHPIVRYDMPSPAELDRLLAEAAAAGTPVYALLFNFEEPRIAERFPGRWELVDRLNQVSLWRPAHG